MKAKYLINNQPVADLRAWCEEKGIKRSKIASLFYFAKYPTKKQRLAGIEPSKTISFKGFEIVKFR